jgi:hypothetical protein
VIWYKCHKNGRIVPEKYCMYVCKDNCPLSERISSLPVVIKTRKK